MAEVTQVIVAGLSQGAIYALLGLGFSIVFLATRILNLAQGSFALWGGFIFLSMVAGAKIPLVISFVIVLVLSAALGLLTQLVVNLRSKPWRPISLDMAVLSTLALLVFFEGAAFMIWGPDPQRGPALENGVFSLFGAIVPWQLAWMIVGAVVIAIGLQIFLRATWSGRAMRACAQNPMMSSLLGINVRRIGALAFALGAMIGATAGILGQPDHLAGLPIRRNLRPQRHFGLPHRRRRRRCRTGGRWISAGHRTKRAPACTRHERRAP